MNGRYVAALGLLAGAVLAGGLWWALQEQGGKMEGLTTPAGPGASHTPETADPYAAEIATFHALRTDEQLDLAERWAQRGELLPQHRAVVAVAIADAEVAPVVRNNMMNLAIAHAEDPGALRAQLWAMARSSDVDPLWQDYCMQYLGLLAQQYPEQAPTVRTHLMEAVATIPNAAGTALLQASRVPLADAQHEQALQDAAADILAADRSSHTAVISALGVVHQVEARELRPMVLAYCAEPHPVAVRRAAVAALGTIGTDADHALLQDLATHEPPVVANVAAAALERLRQR